MPRTFNGANDEIRCSIGNCDITGDVTLAVIMRRNSTGWNGLISTHDSSGAANGAYLEIEASGIGNNVEWGSTKISTAQSTFAVTNADGWVLIAAGKVAGTTTVRFHKYVFSTNTWTHSDGGTAGNPSSCAGGTIRFGEWEDVDDFNGDIAVAGKWNRALTDSELENLVFTLSSWIQSNPVGLWMFDQSNTGQAVLDLTGGGANQSEITGTTVSTTSVPIFNYGNGPWLIIRPQDVGAVTRTVTGDMPASSATLARLLQANRSISGNIPSSTGTLVRLLSAIRSVAGSMPTASAILTYIRLYIRSLEGLLPSQSATLVYTRQYIRALVGDLPSSSGTLTRTLLAFRSITGNMPTSTGVLSRLLSALRNVTGSIPNATGTLEYATGVIFRLVEGAMPTATATLSRVLSAQRSVLGAMPFSTGTLNRIGTFARTLVGALPSASGILTYGNALLRTITGNMPTSTGSVTRVLLALRSISGDLPASTSILIRIGTFSRLVVGSLPTATALLSRVGQFSRTVSGVFGALTGIVSSLLNPLEVLRGKASAGITRYQSTSSSITRNSSTESDITYD